LALRIFGSEAVDVALKLFLYTSLVQSRLVFNQHILAPSVSCLRILVSIHNRAMRRILGGPEIRPRVGGRQGPCGS